ncbi:MAG: TRAP-type transport system small permease protein [Clostridiales bacterium]|nr:TRAP-type transport system small permease protein [Clostridiales bacterium]MDK2933221.1 TRAP-type transport system small permease protein [Clostridiales bacterium]
MMIMLIIMVGSISVNVVGRYFGKAFTWIEEVSSLAFVWMSFMAMVIGFRGDLHPAFEILLEKTNGMSNKLLLSVINVLILIFLVYTFKGGVDYVSKAYIQKTAILGISVAWKYSAIPFATFFMILEAVNKLVVIWKKDKTAAKKIRSEVL